MWLPKGSGASSNTEKKGSNNNKLVAVAIDKDKNSQSALKYAIHNLLGRGQTILLIHVIQKSHSPRSASRNANFDAAVIYDASGSVCASKQLDKQTKELFLTFHCFCTRKDIHCLDIILEDVDVAKALTEYVSYAAIENLVLGASSRNGFIRRFRVSDIPSNVSKGVPDFCSVYVISKSKISSVRNASRSAPFTSPLLNRIQNKDYTNAQYPTETRPLPVTRQLISFNLRAPTPAPAPAPPRTFAPAPLPAVDRTPTRHINFPEDIESIQSPFSSRGIDYHGRFFGDMPESDTDISFVSSGRPSTDYMSSMLNDGLDPGRTSCLSSSTDSSFGSYRLGPKWTEVSSSSLESGASPSSHLDEVEAEMRRLKLELQKTMELYSTACREALSAKQKAVELHRWRVEEEQRLEDARLAEEAALELAENEKAKCRAALETAEAAQRIAQIEAQRRVSAEMKALKDVEEKQKVMTTPCPQNFRYRRYMIDDIEKATEYFAEPRKIGEGGYGPVYRCYLDHTPVAVKVLRPDAAQGRSQFQQEVEVLSCMRHPNMVLLLGACPEYGILVYEYMARGNLEELIFQSKGTPALSWQLRFRIAAEIATGLLFLHQTKPEPLVHRDLKPANILLDHNYVSKISDVGLARLVPPSLADGVTQYRMTSTAGTFCYIDPEYQQTGMLGVKSDVYSFGILLLQLITGKPAMGLTHYVERAMKEGVLPQMLDPAVTDWPMERAFSFAKLALQCAELRRKDRPDLGKVVLPELNKFRAFAEENMSQSTLSVVSPGLSPTHGNVSMTQSTQEVLSEHSGYNSSKSLSSSSSLPEKTAGD